MKQCQTIGCLLNSIPRGRYCQEHRRITKRKSTSTSTLEEEERQNQILINKLLDEEKLEDDRSLRAKQDEDYLEAQRVDLENLKLKELKIERKALLRHKFNDDEKNNIVLQFTFPTHCLKQKHNFTNTTTVSDLYDYVDIVIEDNHLKISPDYQLLVYPNKVFERGSLTLFEIDIKTGSSFFIQ